MDSLQHTPGPWLPFDEHGDCCTETGIPIAHVYQGTHERSCEETKANALLVAAAPRLLNALSMLADWPLRSPTVGGRPARDAAEALCNARRFARAAIVELQARGKEVRQ